MECFFPFIFPVVRFFVFFNVIFFFSFLRSSPSPFGPFQLFHLRMFFLFFRVNLFSPYVTFYFTSLLILLLFFFSQGR